MPYTKAYAGGWQNGSAGTTPIDAASLNVMEAGVQTAFNNFQIAATAPTSPATGHLWYDTTASKLKVWSGAAWVEALVNGASGVSISPTATNTYDLGTASLRWRNIYTQDLHLSNGVGDYTVVEGSEDLFLVNNKSGKSFKFALIEVDPDTVPKLSDEG